jgi:hypothetical protein
LIALGVDDRHLPLAERVVERVVDLVDRQAQPRRRRAIDHEICLEAAVLLVRIYVGQFRQSRQLVGDLWRPDVELGKRIVLQRVLIPGVRLAPADPNVLHRLKNQPRPGDLAHLAAHRAIT